MNSAADVLAPVGSPRISEVGGRSQLLDVYGIAEGDRQAAPLNDGRVESAATSRRRRFELGAAE